MALPAKAKTKHRRGTSDRRDSQLFNLQLDVHDLRQELQDLLLRRSLLLQRRHLRVLVAPYAANRDAGDAALARTERYFTGFRFGYRASDTAQSCFVRSISHSSLSMGVTGFGIAMLLEQWCRYTSFFAVRENVVLSMKCLRLHDDEVSSSASASWVVRTHMEFRGLFTQRGVHEVFPAALREPALLLRLLGSEMRCPLLFHMYFDADARLVRHDVETDFFSAVRNALGGDGPAASRIIATAKIADEGMVGLEDALDASEAEMETNHKKAMEAQELIPEVAVGELRDAASEPKRHAVAFLLS